MISEYELLLHFINFFIWFLIGFLIGKLKQRFVE